MRPVKFTDSHRFQRPYVTAEASKREGYLAERFAEIRAEQAAEQEARVVKLRSISIRTGRKG